MSRTQERPLDAVTLSPAEVATAPARGGVVRTSMASAGPRVGRFVVVEGGDDDELADVVMAEDPELGRRVALRLLPIEDEPGDGVRAARAMAGVVHPNVVTIYEVGQAEGRAFIAMERVEGEPLTAWLATPRRWRDVLAVFVAAGRGLEAAHRAGVIHGDVTAARVQLGRDGRPRVADFGLAERVRWPGVDEPVRGAPDHLAPERWRGVAADARSDQYAFAVALWTALWGRPPIEAATIAALRQAVLDGARPTGAGAPRWLARVLTRSLASVPAERWPSMTELLAAIDRGLVARRQAWRGGAAVALAAATLVGLVTVERNAARASLCLSPACTEVARRAPTLAPAARLELEALRRELATLRATIVSGRRDGAVAASDALLVRARHLGDPATLGRALDVRWRASYQVEDGTAVLPFLRELTTVAAEARDDAVAATAWATMAVIAAQRHGEADQAQVMLASAHAATTRAGDPPAVRIEVLGKAAEVALSVDDHAGARTALAEALRLLDATGASDPAATLTLATLLHTEGRAAWYANELTAAVAAHRGAIAAYDRALGPSTGEVARVYVDLGQVLRDQRRHADALVALDEAVRILDAHGESSRLAVALVCRSSVRVDLGDTAAGLVDAQRALEIARRVMPDDAIALAGIESDVARAYHNAGLALRDAARVDTAAVIYRKLLATATRAGWSNSNVAIWWVSLADLERRRERCAAALPAYVRAGEVIVATSADSPVRGYVLRGEGACLHALGRTADAIDRLEQARRAPTSPSMVKDVALGDGLLGQLLADTGRDRPRGIALVRAAVAALEAAGSTDERVPGLVAWLRRHGGAPRRSE